MSKRPLHLSSPKEVRAALTKIVNELRTNSLTPAQGNAMICGCNAILQSIRMDEQERRMAEIEKHIQHLEGGYCGKT